jgi:[ribosomal protein S5]-alanine N-acetyltransferase
VVSAQASARPARLRLERPWREHLVLYRDLFEDPAVAARLRPGSEAGAGAGHTPAEILAADIQHWQQHAFGPWIFSETVTGVFVGRGGLRRSTVLGAGTVELLYALHPDSWGKGYATEMAMIAMVHARRLGLQEVVGFTAVGNHASRRVLEGAGLHFEAIFQHAGLPHWLGRATLTSPRAQAHARGHLSASLER